MKRLDEMDFNEISAKYKDIFKDLILNSSFDKITRKINNIYNEYNSYYKKGYKIKGGTLGRGELKWGRNIIWGWYIEMILMDLFLKNKLVKEVKFLGTDSSHAFIYDSKLKKIDIVGRKTVEPDFIIKLKNNKEFCVELKTAAVEVFSIKKGNIEQLYKETAYNNRITLIMMIDLENSLYGLENLNYFNTSRPFVNQRMEGQLCYNFPSPNKEIGKILEEDFMVYLDENIFNIDKVKKLRALKMAEESNNEDFIRIIKNKIKLEIIIEEKKVQLEQFNKKIKEIKNKIIIDLSWNEIYKKFKIN